MALTVLALSIGGEKANSEALNREASLIRSWLAREDAAVVLRLEVAHVDRATELRAILEEQEPAIVHLVGRGGELTLEDRAIPPERLAALLARDGDIHGLLVQDAPPDRRMGLRPTATADGRRYWVIGP